MNLNIIYLVLACSATAHLVMTSVVGLYARHKIEYLCLAWVNGLFGFALVGAYLFADVIISWHPGMLHPWMLLTLVATCYLQSIYPLSIPMPGFLQWGRMWKYARPALVLIVLYVAGVLLGSRPQVLNSLDDVRLNLISSDVLLRISSLGLSVYYIINIFRLPRQMAHSSDVPRYLFGYCMAQGISVLYYMFTATFYSPRLLMGYVLLFTMLNMYLCFRTLETMALRLPKPDIAEVESEPSPEVVAQAEREDFNEANRQRFQRIEFWMQNNREAWKDNTFGRDALCREVGYNRHLLLQSIRSQGYNNVHEYINTYRIRELKRLIQKGEVQSASECSDVGFAAVKTARVTFEKMEGMTLDNFLERHSR